MKRTVFTVSFLFFLAIPASARSWKAREVNLLSLMGLRFNGAGPLLVKADPPRNRVVLAETLTSSVTLVEGRLDRVRNIPTGRRIPQYLKDEALAVDPRTGDVYLVGDHCLIVVDSDRETAAVLETPRQFETVAVDPATGRAFLAGRESPDLGIADPKTRKLRLLPWSKKTAPTVNLNQTPPPPIRKLAWDSRRNRLVAADGFTSTLWILDGKKEAWSSHRPLPLPRGGRWHLAGFTPSTGRLYLVAETDKRKAVLAASIDTLGTADRTVPLPGFTEPVGILLDPGREEVFIPYDNFPSVHVVDFKAGKVSEIALPAYGNDASALDRKAGLLYVASWAHGEVEVLDLEKGRLVKRIRDLGILPHMFSMAWNPVNRRLYIPIGATAVNGSFGAALTILDPATGKHRKVRTGFAPVDLVPLPGWKGALVFGNEDRAALVGRAGRVKILNLPKGCLFPLLALPRPEGGIYLSYGPHQSYWPNVYIWGARDGILEIRGRDLSFYDRRLPRQAQDMALDEKGVLYALQNNWGTEEPFLSVLRDGVRLWQARDRILLGGKVTRETTQSVIRYDRKARALYILRAGEKDTDPGVFLRVLPAKKKPDLQAKTGRTPVDLAFDQDHVVTADFDSHSLTVIDKASGKTRTLGAPREPLRILAGSGVFWVLCHRGRKLARLDPGTWKSRTYTLPGKGLPDELALVEGAPWVVCHGPDSMEIYRFAPKEETFQKVLALSYPFGETAFDKGNASFFARGRFGDGIFHLSRIRPEGRGRVWVSDFLSGRIFLLEP